jgi:enoyl-CoA hydratase/carnithine racemase
MLLVSDYDQIIYEVTDPVAVITLNRPDQLNAWTARMGNEVKDAVGRAERDPAVVGMVLTGAGRGFCAGADLTMLSGLGGDSGQTDLLSQATAKAGDPTWGDDFQGEYTYLMSVPKPIVAAINGPIAGMGVPIALACDLRFMATDAVLTTAFSQRGLIAEWGVAWLLPRLIGTAVTLDLLWSSRRIDGAEAERLGLVKQAVPGGEVVDVARRYIQELAERASPTSLAIMKRQVYQQLHAGLGAAEKQAQDLMRESFTRPDFREGVESYLQKRPPKFARYEA